MPSNNTLTLSPDLTSYTAPCDGYLYATFASAGYGIHGGLHNQNNSLWSYLACTIAQCQELDTYMLMAKGQVCNIVKDGTNVSSLRFIYAQSEV